MYASYIDDHDVDDASTFFVQSLKNHCMRVNADSLALREGAGLSFDLNGQRLKHSDLFRVVVKAGRVSADGYDWIAGEVIEDGRTGFVADAFLGEFQPCDATYE